MKQVRFDADGLVPAIVQDATSKEVLTLAYMNQQSLEKTIETKEAWFFSRSRQELWHKGATSGNTQKVINVRYDCDRDAVLVSVKPNGPACHTGNYSCFSETLFTNKLTSPESDRFDILNELEATIAKRQAEMPTGAYTTYLFNEGVDKILKKVGEEASEVIIAAKNRDHEELRMELADLYYHTFVLMREQGVSLDGVLQTMRERHSK
ncbi:bifunctional phosphoribosyl-AMP cyclohydrolase/phosphoribosyl-ATP diphosphatase HisIE [Shouchella patagoniensis]|uniref:bifunctional phosphoribosyl-AMP cyclohydrolase/phosphoribosyl-ATP diphosphatase HisIE n=1 Tax=Shouchella patagoniensis TaxID=228576 RepID=UPI0009953644|nr:bifunctional phosphoribosyl-AMP cyclohydrolase/phosphoribosyl-ATP diphosphatase HisIE [Shouchella patagoniensis]